ncbi:uncharacterized protein GGS22DRAFT_151190, partial [Annulohypoxylon maeteangense]|uniref:uncharacterized protein n=1 Tax=Annulohypoxylon maeteangense TaxID=1927788 RepID=UPI0020087A2B
MSSGITDFDVALVPMQLDAFRLNPAVCGTGEDDDTTARISPITQPNYTFLRLDNFLLQGDVQNHTDLHNTAPATVNPRMSDIGARPRPTPLRHRHGIYLHWTLPRFYRAGVSTGKAVSSDRRRKERLRRGLDVPDSDVGDASNDTPEFVEPPTRWIVVRKIELDSIAPPEAKSAFEGREYEAWVVESDHLWTLEEIPLDFDLQTDVTPFIVGHKGSDVNIDEQAEVFIGRKSALRDWSGNEDPDAQPPNISLLQSGNQLFADFQMHNANVFSILDNFEYGTAKAPQYLTHAKASYYVLGWHWKEDVDPLWKSGKSVAHGESLQALFMTLQGATESPPEERDPWLDEESQLRILCHGAMYDVVWDYDTKPGDVPADQFNARLVDQNQAAVSLGTTPIDALLSYCHARKDHPDGPGDVTKLEEDILLIEKLLHARDDGVEAQREAADSVYNWSFNRSPGGSHYYFSGQGNDGQSNKQPIEPDRLSILKLRELNQAKTLQDSCSRALTQYRWDMFSLWWKYVSDVGNKSENQTSETNKAYEDAATKLSDHIAGLNDRIQQLQTQIDDLLQPKDDQGEPVDPAENPLETAQPASMPVFYRANDPTILIGGVETGWPIDYLDKVLIRAPFQTISPAGGLSNLPDALKNFFTLLQKVPDVFKGPAEALMAEFYAIRPTESGSAIVNEGTFYPPQFHDQLNTDGRWRDQWGDRQPWFPLYAEWEVEYTHIPMEYWKLDEHTARLSETPHVRYGISVPTEPGQTPQPLWDAIPKEMADTRVLSGRVLILPQPSFSLEAKVTQLFDNTPADILKEYIDEDEQANLRNNIKKLSYLSSPLSGFYDALVTQAQGSHIKPENKVVGPDGEFSSVIGSAVINDAGLTETNIGMIQGNSALTPYASSVNFSDGLYCPFKPATHGQFRFRKLNIIDKFGQALMAIDQRPRVGGFPPYYPCISDYYEPQTIKLPDGETYANTAIQNQPKLCEFLQLPPQINQNSRLNANFVKRIADDPDDINGQGLEDGSGDEAKWRPSTEWESPIWGWVITNYADYGIQIFLPDGTFYREVRFGGPLGALESPKWLPFEPSMDDSTPETRQLDLLVDKLTNPKYLQGFWHMITDAQDKLPAAPSSYAQFLNSIVGKPLALVNMGWSLELDGPPLEIQSTKAQVKNPERLLTKPVNPDDKTPFYELQVRLGDADAAYDGLVGYFDTTSPDSDELNLDYIRTFFTPEADNLEPLRRLNTETYPLFTPFWEAPFPTDTPFDDPTRYINPAQFENKRNSRMSVFGAIIDPFTPVHAYSSFLPPTDLSLPSWTWQQAMNTMTAFFHAGPLTLPINSVPTYDKDNPLTNKNARDRPPRDLPLPSLGPGDWSWFQPYDESTGQDGTVYNAFGVDKRGDLTKPGFQKGPYSAVEGFLQLRNPIMVPKAS